MSDSLRALTVVASAEAERRATAHAEACAAEQRARATLDDAIERCRMIEDALAQAMRERGSSASDRALAEARAAVWRERRATARGLRAAAERAYESARAAVERSRESLGTAHGDRRVAETALSRAEDAARQVRARRAEDDGG